MSETLHQGLARLRPLPEPTPAVRYGTETTACEYCGKRLVVVLRGETSTVVPCDCGGKPATPTYTRIGHQPGAEAKILARLDAFRAKGWSDTDLWERGQHDYPGLAYILRPHLSIGSIFTWCVQLLHPSIAGRYSSWTTYYRTAPEATLLATVGLHVRPESLIVKRYY